MRINFTLYVSPTKKSLWTLDTNCNTDWYVPLLTNSLLPSRPFAMEPLWYCWWGAACSALRMHWLGPYQIWGSSLMYWRCGGEDPFLYVDQRTWALHWHCLFHAAPFPNSSIAGGHAFSLDDGSTTTTTWHTAPMRSEEIFWRKSVRMVPPFAPRLPSEKGPISFLTTMMGPLLWRWRRVFVMETIQLGSV
jgi:hypothetical protein